MSKTNNLGNGQLQTTEEIYKEMVRLYTEEHGCRGIHEAYKALLPVRPDKIGIELFSAIEDSNTYEMKRQGICPGCAIEVIRRTLPATRHKHSEEIVECPKCLEEFPELL